MRHSSQQGMRRRAARHEPTYKRHRPSSMATKFKSLDLFQKIDSPNEKESRVRTESGGCLSIIGIALIAWLVLSQLYYYIFPLRREHLIVDKMYDKKLDIRFDITFHSIPCSSLGVDVMDVTGEQQVHVNQDVTKQRLDLQGNKLGKAVNEKNGIESMLFQYMRMDRSAEGCRVTGQLHIQKVSGNFHLALGAAHDIHGKHIHQFVLSDIPRFNCSHTINELSFGEYFPGQQLPLNTMSHTIEKEGGGVFTYNLKIIPVEYLSAMGYKTYSNTYSYSYKYRHIPPTQPGQRMQAALPGIFFVYKINPYMLQISKERESFVSFIVNLCAIAGGIFAISGFLDAVTFNISMLTKAKEMILPTRKHTSHV
eukprot:6206_1